MYELHYCYYAYNIHVTDNIAVTNKAVMRPQIWDSARLIVVSMTIRAQDGAVYFVTKGCFHSGHIPPLISYRCIVSHTCPARNPFIYMQISYATGPE
jgi:hypothetical protein